MQDDICQHEIVFGGVIDPTACSVVKCKCLDCGFEQVVKIEDLDLSKTVTVNKKFNEFKPVSYEMAQKCYQEMKKINQFRANILIMRKYR